MGTTLVFGASWSVESWEIRQILEKWGVSHEYLDIEANPRVADWLCEQVGEKADLPVLFLSNGMILVAPQPQELTKQFGMSAS